MVREDLGSPPKSGASTVRRAAPFHPMSYKIIVTKVAPSRDVSATEAGPGVYIPPPDEKVYEQVLEELDIAKFVVALNKRPRVRKQKAVK